MYSIHQDEESIPSPRYPVLLSTLCLPPRDSWGRLVQGGGPGGQGQAVDELCPTRGDTQAGILPTIYRVIFLIVHQEQVCCELIFALLRSPKASMCPQDRAQITFW